MYKVRNKEMISARKSSERESIWSTGHDWGLVASSYIRDVIGLAWIMVGPSNFIMSCQMLVSEFKPEI